MDGQECPSYVESAIPGWTVRNCVMSVRDIYNKHCSERFPPIAEEDVSGLESRIDVDLPETYREYLLEFNGGYFDDPLIIPPVPEVTPTDGLSGLFGIGAPLEDYELGNMDDILLWEDNDPPVAVPIGLTPVGKFIWLFVRGDDRGEIWLRDFGATYFLAYSIEELFDLLQFSENR